MILFLLAALTATPATLPAQIARAGPGATITLAPGDYGTVTITRRVTRPIVINAAAARLRVVFRRASGFELRGGSIAGAHGRGAAGYGVSIDHSDHITIAGSAFSDSQRGIVINASTDVLVSRSTFIGLVVDGINIAGSQRVTVRDSACRDFNSGEAHPDCIQMWSRPGAITSDVLITGNQALGHGMQGFTAFNHVRNGVDDGGFDRIAIVGNTVVGDYPQGVALYDCRRCRVTGNRTSRLPGARWKVSVNVVRCAECEVGSNRIGA